MPARPVWAGRVPYVVELMLDQRAKLRVAAGDAVVRCQSDQERRHTAEPLDHLLFLAGLLPAARAEHDLFGLAQHGAAGFFERARRPKECQVGIH